MSRAKNYLFKKLNILKIKQKNSKKIVKFILKKKGNKLIHFYHYNTFTFKLSPTLSTENFDEFNLKIFLIKLLINSSSSFKG